MKSPTAVRRLRVCFLIALFFLPLSGAAGERESVFLPDLLPANTIFCTVPPESATLERDFTRTVFSRIAALPEMGPFLQSFEESRRRLAEEITQSAHVPPPLAAELVDGRIGLALLNMGIARDGTPAPEFVIAISLRSHPDRNTVFSAVMALLNRPEVVRSVLESQGIDPNIPLRTLAQEETVTGAPPILRIGPNIRVAAVGNLVLLYHGQGSDGIRKIFDAYADRGSSLTANSAFQAAYRGAEAGAGTSFCYINIPRAISLLDAANMSQVSRVAEALGLGTVQSAGVSGAYHRDGVRHSLYLHTPGGNFSGLMSALVPTPPDAPVGMEGYGGTIPSAAEAFLAARVDMRLLLRELPYVLDALGAVTRPGGVAGLVASERILGVSPAEILDAAGTDVVIRPHDDTQALVFQNVDIARFEALIARMEQSAGERFSQLNVGGYIVRYFNRRSSIAVPLAPAFCLVPRQPGSQSGILYMASHPQAVSSLIQESLAAREPLSGTPDFLRASGGVEGNYSLFYYNGNRECHRRFYNFLLPVLSLWASSSKFPVDTGLLPVSGAITPAMFGSALGIQCLPEGMRLHAYSPFGFGAILVQLADKLVISNPLVMSYAYAAIEEWMNSMPSLR